MTAPLPTKGRAMGGSPWLVSARVDLAIFTLPALLSLGLGAFAGRFAGAGGVTPVWAWLVLVVGIDVAHVHGTTLRVYLDPAELGRRAVLYGLVPALGLAAGVVAYACSALLFWRLLAYLAVWHFVRQQLGWLRLYRRRAGESGRSDRYLDEATIYAATLYPLLAWHARLPDTRMVWFVPGDFVAGLPGWVAAVARPVWAALLLAFVARQAVLWASGRPVAWGKILLVAATAATWWAGIVLWQNDFAFTVTNVVGHGIPYMVISYRVSTGDNAGPSRSRVAALLGAGRFPLYGAALGALAFVEEWLWDRAVWNDHPRLFPGPLLDVESLWWLVVPLLALPQLTHYVLDAYLWRLDGTNPGLAEALGVPPRITSAAPADTSETVRS